MENNNKKNIANTMEINSILEEARRHRSGAAAPQQKTTTGQKKTTAQKTNQNVAKTQVVKKTAYNSSFNDSFVVYDDALKSSKSKNNNKAKKAKKSKKGGVIVAVVLVLLIVLGAGGFCAYNYFGDFAYASNIYVNGISIGGMSEEEAQQALAAQEKALEDEINVVVNVQDKSSTFTKDNFEYTFNTDEVLKEAKKYSEENLIPKGQQDYTIALTVKEDCVSDISASLAKQYNQEPEDAVVTKFNSAKSGSDMFTIQDEKTGVAVKTEEFESQLKEFFAQGKVNGTIEAGVEETKPERTAEFLRNNIKKVSSFKTVSTNGANGNSNMALSMKACNNSIVNPGDVWSFNKCTGNSNLTSLGYKPAGVLNGGRSEVGIGGGICQSSTTIYNAAMMCGMKVVERQPHYTPSTYVPIGLDATIDYGNIDLKLENIFDYQLFFECYMEGTTLYCNIYGLENEDFDEIKLSSSRAGSYSDGYGATASRTYYLNGKKVKTEDLPSSRYYYQKPASNSSSTSSKKPSSKPADEDKPDDTPSDVPPTPDPEPTPTPDPVPTPDPQPTPDVTPTPDPVPEA